MKTVTGKILSSKTVTVAQARSLLSEFVNNDTGASQAVGAYVRRATAAFDELMRAHSKAQRRRGGDEKAACGDGEEKTVERVSLVNNGGLRGQGAGEVKEEEGKGGFRDSRNGEGKRVIKVKEEDGFVDEKKAKKKEEARESGSLEENGSVVKDIRAGGIKVEAKREKESGELKREEIEEKRLKRKSGGGVEEEEEVGTEEHKQSKKKKKRRKDGEDDH